MPDQQSGCVIKTGVSEIEIVAKADGAGVRMVAAQNRIAVSAGASLRQNQAGLRRESQGGRDDSGVSNKAAACSHRGASLSAELCESKETTNASVEMMSL